MNSILKTISALALVLIFISCGSGKSLTKKTNNNATTRSIITKHEASEVNFKTLQARLRGSYETEEESQSISISMRMQKDSTIWLSAKLAGIIPLAKVLITPNRVKYYEKINGTFFDGDFSLLSKWLGTELDFKKVQNLLIGQTIYNLNNERYTLENTAKGYQLKSGNQSGIIKAFLLDAANYRTRAQQLIRKSANQSVTITYPEYQRSGNYIFPKEINIVVNQSQKNTQIAISYRSLDFDREVSFPFEIPKGYEEIIIE